MKAQMTAFILLTLGLMLCACTHAAASDTIVPLSTTSQCVVFHDSTLALNATRIPRDQVPTISTSTTTGADIVKTAVFTPRPCITTTDITSFLYKLTTVLRGDSRVPTIYTSTATVEITSWGTYTMTITITKTVSLAATSTLPAFPGYTPLAARNDSFGQIGQKYIAESDDDWELQDEYWDPHKGVYYRDSTFNRGRYPTIVACYATVFTANFYSTATLRRSIPQLTYTRTRFVDTATLIRTVNVYATSANLNSTCTVSTDRTITKTYSTYMADVTHTETATIEVYSSTTTAYAACATDNVINSIDVSEGDMPEIYAFDALRLPSNGSNFDISRPSATSALDCCAFAAVDPNAWFYRYQKGRCTIWVGRDCPVGGNETRAKAEVWWSAQMVADPWRDGSMVVGNGACGGIGQIWPYIYR